VKQKRQGDPEWAQAQVKRSARYTELNREKCNERGRIRRAANREYYATQARERYLKNPAPYVTSRQNRRARKRGAEGSFTTDEFKAKLELYKNKCHWCRRKIKGYPHADHLIALVQGGSNFISNIVPSCADCNMRKGAKLPYEFMEGRLL
jgi:5-methylcytosine-specific restriction endonuclease McrA